METLGGKAWPEVFWSPKLWGIRVSMVFGHSCPVTNTHPCHRALVDPARAGEVGELSFDFLCSIVSFCFVLQKGEKYVSHDFRCDHIYTYVCVGVYVCIYI
jgi:hypothetical protein